MNRGALVGGFLETEVVGKAFVVVGRISERVAFAQRAPGIDVEQFGSRVAYLFGGLALGLFPLARPQPVQRRFTGTDTGVTAN